MKKPKWTKADKLNIKEALEDIKKDLIKEHEHSSNNTMYSLCSSGASAYWENEDIFRDYIKYVHRNRKVFYKGKDYFGDEIVKCDDSSWFHWNPYNFEVRLKWLDNHIKLNTEKL